MKVGDLIQYKPGRLVVATAVVLKVNNEGGTIKAIDQSGDIRWMVLSGCEVINESRRFG